MHRIICLVRGHRVRIVQHFGPHARRIKCVRCGGDWGMNDDARAVVEWCPELEQFYRDSGYTRILESEIKLLA